MPVHWYYQNREGDVGPVSLAELKYLINLGNITASTLVRSGEDGLWLAAGGITGLSESSGDAGHAGESAPESPEWHFNLKGQKKRGPVTWSALREMITGGQLQPDELVWKPGMALWVPASQVRGLLEESSSAGRDAPRLENGRGLPVGPRAIWAGVAALVLLVAVVGWTWKPTKSNDLANSGRGRTSPDPLSNCLTTHSQRCASNSLNVQRAC
jgi:hypothetical protein